MTKPIFDYAQSTVARRMRRLLETEDAQTRKSDLRELMEYAGQGPLSTLLLDIRRGRRVVTLDDGLSAIGTAIDGLRDIEAANLPPRLSEFFEIAKSVRLDVATAFSIMPPVVVINLNAGHCDFHMSGGTDGFGILNLSEMAIQDDDIESALRHEFTHAVILTSNLFLDEGLATLMEYPEISSDVGQTLKSGFPDIRACLGTDWTQDPYLNALTHDYDGSAHVLAAAFIRYVLTAANLTLGEWVAFASDQKAALTGPLAYRVIEDTFGVSVNGFKTPAQTFSVERCETLHAESRNILAMGYVDKALAEIGNYRQLAAFAETTNRVDMRVEHLAAYARVILCLALSPIENAHLFKAEAHIAIEAVLKTAPETSIAALLGSYLDILKGQSAATPMDRNAANRDAADNFEAMLQLHGTCPEIVIAAAKTQTYLPDQCLAPASGWPSLIQPLQDDPVLGALARQLSQHPALMSKGTNHAVQDA